MRIMKNGSNLYYRLTQMDHPNLQQRGKDQVGNSSLLTKSHAPLTLLALEQTVSLAVICGHVTKS